MVPTESLARSADELRRQLLTRYAREQLDGAQLRHAGRVFFGDPEALSLYGRRPAQLEQLGLRVLGRSAIEACVDAHARPMAKTVCARLAARPHVVLDLFAGTGNLAFHLARACGVANVVAYEADPAVHECLAANFCRLGLPYRTVVATFPASVCLDELSASGPALVVVDPPWGADAFSFARGLDLRRTEPPVPDVLHALRAAAPVGKKTMCLIKTHELARPDGIAAVSRLLEAPCAGTIRASVRGSDVGYVVGSLRHGGQAPPRSRQYADRSRWCARPLAQ